MVDQERIQKLNDKPVGSGPIIYWMSRDQRVKDNWAILYAQELANEHDRQLKVCFYLIENHPFLSERHFEFMLGGLKEVKEDLTKLNIPFQVVVGDGVEVLKEYLLDQQAGAVVTDLNPLRGPTGRSERLAQEIEVALYVVDAHNLVPVWSASDKEEFAARTFRPKITKKLSKFLIEFPRLSRQPSTSELGLPIDWENISIRLAFDQSVPKVKWLRPGGKAAKKTLQNFLDNKLTGYSKRRNDPNEDSLSNLSPYLHYGQLSAARVALEVKACRALKADKDTFLEELIVRRELADNFCYYNTAYDKVLGAHAWAQATIKEHEKDAREYIYPLEELESSKTHDDLWNATQRQMVWEGKMHGWCRMYWAKKILEWTPDAQTAIDTALYLNDKYELDGRDPSGVVGVMWSIVGVHDRAWSERPVFGKIRYMNYNGAKRKFDVAAYVEKFNQAHTSTL